ncbi:homoserine O-succinyltransferase MetX [Vulcaniibacterium tengchongense]|uniref:Homoserine O-acetyltransferase n=1 Tax=Vulcaniibacterium tengchongense TaxID=1273429 RepID=A0A3N4VD92_9GAMM|nr:homoserine O-succinyltransferase [Vulcaniibacterium tengchongense]RPE80972.1 homoserine O-acetyltransferase [Vulcaniibacterium tengchongense]
MSLANAATPAEFAAPRDALAPAAAALAASGPAAFRARRGELELELALRHAGRRTLRLRYEILGEARLPAIFVAGGISAHRHLAASAAFPEPGWWPQQVGAGRALDPRRHRLIAFDWLGADGALDAPLDPADQADAIAALLDVLGVAGLDAFVGCSYGAMVGLQFAARHGRRLRQLVAISGAHRAHPYASAWRALQRRAVALGALQCDETHGLALARQLAILSYRTPEEFAERFGAARVSDGRVRVGAEDYLDHCGARYVERTSPTAYLRLSESIDLQDVDPGAIRLPVTVVTVAEDRLVPPSEAYDLVERLRGETRLRVLRSLYGHDAFLKEEQAIAAVLGEALDDCTEAAA